MHVGNTGGRESRGMLSVFESRGGSKARFCGKVTVGKQR